MLNPSYWHFKEGCPKTSHQRTNLALPLSNIQQQASHDVFYHLKPNLHPWNTWPKQNFTLSKRLHSCIFHFFLTKNSKRPNLALLFHHPSTILKLLAATWSRGKTENSLKENLIFWTVGPCLQKLQRHSSSFGALFLTVGQGTPTASTTTLPWQKLLETISSYCKPRHLHPSSRHSWSFHCFTSKASNSHCISSAFPIW